jgi:hypothetical protein
MKRTTSNSYLRPCVANIGLVLHVLVSSTSLAQTSDTTVIRIDRATSSARGTLVHELTVGEGSGDEVYRFTSARVSIGRSGSAVYITNITFDGLSQSQVRQYDPRGVFVRAVGRPGEGPGEYVYGVGDVEELPDGRLLVSDGRGVIVYSRNGAFLARLIARARAINFGSAIMVDPLGLIYVYGMTYASGNPSRTATTVWRPFRYRFRLDGTLVDSVAATELEFPDPSRMGRVVVPFIPTYVAAWSPLGYFVTAHRAAYAIDLRLPQTAHTPANHTPWQPGDRVVSLRRITTPVPVLQGERTEWQRSILMFMRTGGGSPAWQWSGPDIPSTKPPVSELFVARDGRIWVRLSQVAALDSNVRSPLEARSRADSSDLLRARARWVEPFVVDVIEPDGRFVGQVRMPDRLWQFDAIGDTVWTVELDSLEVPTVRRYRIRWSSNASREQPWRSPSELGSRREGRDWSSRLSLAFQHQTNTRR